MRKQTKRWTTKNGEKIRICDMEDSHLINTINFLRRMAEGMRGKTISNAYQLACFVQGEIAESQIDQDIMTMEESTYEEWLPNIFWNLHDDALRRGLDV